MDQRKKQKKLIQYRDLEFYRKMGMEATELRTVHQFEQLP